jgi:hypothetical protein
MSIGECFRVVVPLTEPALVAGETSYAPTQLVHQLDRSLAWRRRDSSRARQMIPPPASGDGDAGLRASSGGNVQSSLNGPHELVKRITIEMSHKLTDMFTQIICGAIQN